MGFCAARGRTLSAMAGSARPTLCGVNGLKPKTLDDMRLLPHALRGIRYAILPSQE